MAFVESELNDPKKFAIFKEAEALSQPLSAGLAPADASGPEYGAAFRKLIDAGLDQGGGGKLLFTYGTEKDGFCLIYVWFKPHMMIPRHYHGQDCLYYILSGSAILGRQVLRRGDGFFVPGGQTYAYRAGDEGIEILEFRHVAASAIDGQFTDLRPWDQFLEIVRTNRAAWERETVPPSRRAVAAEPA